jgi:predicted peptidase
MRKTSLLVSTALWSALFVSPLFVSLARADAPRQAAQSLDKQIPVKLDYLLYLPKDYDKQESWPLVIFLHGAGERGNDLELVKKHGPPKLIDEGKDFPAIVVSPQCMQGRWWHAQLLELTALVDEIEAKYKIDKSRIYLTGLSMGGFGTWALAAYTPDRFAALVPICGGGESLGALALVRTPVWAFHGAKDPVVPLKRSQDMVDALTRFKGNVQFTVYPEALHDSWTETYNNQDVWKWLFEQKRNAPAATAKAESK